MGGNALGALINIDNRGSPIIIKDPSPVHQKKESHASKGYELDDDLTLGSRLNSEGAAGPNSGTNGTQTPLTLTRDGIEIIGSHPTSNAQIEEPATDLVQTLSNPPMNKYRLLSACLMCFGNGLNGKENSCARPIMRLMHFVCD